MSRLLALTEPHKLLNRFMLNPIFYQVKSTLFEYNLCIDMRLQT